jgi:hypothetical protein
MIKRLHVLYSKHRLDEEEYRAMIMELTDGRTDTTKELTYAEAQYLAGYITGANTKLHTTAKQMAAQAIKKQRSAVLKRLQQIGINTASWDAVNSYLKSPRIAGKPLYDLDSDELAALIPKLESIKRKQNEET